MALSFLDNVDYRGKKPNFTRDLFVDIATMAAFNENYLPNVFMACNEEDGQPYIFNRDNAVDATLGKWRPIEGGIDGSVSWDTLIGKPFKDIDDNLNIKDYVIVETEKGLQYGQINNKDVAPFGATSTIFSQSSI